MKKKNRMVLDLDNPINPNASKYLVTYRLTITGEIYSDEIYTKDPPDKLLKFIWDQWFNDGEAELISITKF